MTFLAKLTGIALAATLTAGASACATVRPEQRAALADPVMQYDDESGDRVAREHALENREASYGGSSVKGGGCGCN